MRNLVTEGELESARLLPPQAAAPTRSRARAASSDSCGDLRLPRPRVERRRSRPYEIDFAWPAHRVLVEVDGFRAHGHRSRSSAIARGTPSSRRSATSSAFTWRQIVHEPLVVAARVAQALALRADGNVARRA